MVKYAYANTIESIFQTPRAQEAILLTSFDQICFYWPRLSPFYHWLVTKTLLSFLFFSFYFIWLNDLFIYLSYFYFIINLFSWVYWDISSLWPNKNGPHRSDPACYVDDNMSWKICSAFSTSACEWQSNAATLTILRIQCVITNIFQDNRCLELLFLRCPGVWRRL